MKKTEKLILTKLNDRHSSYGNKLDDKPDLLDLKKFENKNIYYYETVDSTNLIARRLAGEGAPNFSTVVAEEQQEGRGRLGRSWFSPRGTGLWFSIILRPDISSQADAAPVTLVTAAVLADYLRDHLDLPVLVKWPNDLLVGKKKTGGILTEIKGELNRVSYLVVGVGLNINQQENDFPAELCPRATSLSIEKGKLFNRTELFLSIKNELEKAYRLFFAEGFSPFYQLWKKYNSTLGQNITVSRPGGILRGKALDLTEDGALLLQDERGDIRIINYGEII